MRGSFHPPLIAQGAGVAGLHILGIPLINTGDDTKISFEWPAAQKVEPAQTPWRSRNLPEELFPQGVKNGGSGGARTRNLCRDRAAL